MQAFRRIARLAIETLIVCARIASTICLPVGFCLPGSLHLRGLGFDLPLPLPTTVFGVAPLLLYSVCFCLYSRPLGGILARPTIFFIDLLPSNALRLCLGIGSCSGFSLTLCLSLKSVASRPLHGVAPIVPEEGGRHDAFFNEKPNTACGDA